MKNTFVKVLSLVMALAMVMSSFVFAASAAETGHTHAFTETVVEATCISKGHTVYTCECGYFYSGNPTNILEDCREEDLKDVPASAPTCTEPAYTAHKECKLCGEVYGKEAVKGSKPNGHTFELAITDPDCGVAAGMKQVCTVCGYSETQVTCPPDEPCTLAGHDVDDYVYVITLAPTCTTNGKADYVCPVEGCTGGYRDITITKRGHAYGPAVVVDPDCVNAGSSTKTCSRCGDQVVTPINALRHNYVNVTDPTHDCVIDNEEVDILFQDSTCYQAGYQWKHCTRCDDLTKADVAKKPHNWVVDADDKDGDRNKTELLYFFEVAGEHYTETTLARMIAYLEANVADFKKCTTTINAYKKCADCAHLERDDDVSRVAPGHTWESKVWTGTAAESAFCSTKGWEIVWDEDNATNKKPCAEGAKNYYIRECTECTYDDKTYYFTVDHTKVYVCADNTCDTTKKITLYDGSQTTVDYCYDCTHADRVYVCYVCGGDSSDAHYDAHDFEVTTVVKEEATCIMPAKYEWVCKNPECNVTKDDYKPEQLYTINTDDGPIVLGLAEFVNKNNHSNSVEEVEATCVSQGYRYGYCDWCQKNVDEKWNDADAHSMDPAKHVDYVAPTCKTLGTAKYDVCLLCTKEFGSKAPIPMDPENHEGTLDTANPVKIVYATCTTPYAELCKWTCCDALGKNNVGQVNPANHVLYTYEDNVITGSQTLLFTVAAIAPDCTTAGIHKYTYCTGCDYVVDVDTELCIYDDHRYMSGTKEKTNCAASDGGNACANIHCTLATHKTLESYEEVIPANILALKDASTGAYNNGKTIKEAWVKEYYKNNNKNTDVAKDFIIAELGHNFWFDKDVTKTTDTNTNNILLVYLYATCTAPGNEWKIQCNRCTEIDPVNNGETILPHGVDADKFHRFDSVLYATCTEYGHKQGIFCDDCSKAGDPHGQACSICNGNDYVLPKTGHTLVEHKAADTKDANCVEAGFIIKKCCNIDENTGKECYIVSDATWKGNGADYTPALGADNHSYTTITTQADCANGGYDTHVCDNCGDTYTDNETPALGHKDANGNTLLFNCKDYLYNRGVKCDVCGEEVTVDNNGDVVDGINNEFIDHNYQVVVINPGCEVDGETYEKCADCGHIKQAKDQATGEWSDIRTTIPATGHDVADVVEEKCVAATPEHDGLFVWICGNCGGEFEKALHYTRNVEFDLSVVPYIDGKNSADLTFVNGGFIEVLVTVSTEDLVFSSFEYRLGYDSDLLTFVSAETIFDFGSTYVADNGDNVSVSGWFAGDKTGTFDGLDVEVLKIIFQVAPGVNTIDDNVLGSIGVQFDNATTETINTPVYNGITDEIELALMGDLNADGQYSMEDVKLIKDLVGGEYNNVADIDNNGIVNIRDYGLLVAFVTSNQTIADYYAMFGIDIVALADAYDHNDYDASGEITNVDAKIFRDVIIEIGQNYWEDVVEYELGDFTYMLESVDYDLIP